MPNIKKHPVKATAATVTTTTTTVLPPSPAVTVARVPQGFSRKYIHRNVNGVLDFKLFDTALDLGKNILLEGPTGPGKTTAFLAYAEEQGMNFFAIPSNVAIEPSQMFGKPWNRNGVWEWIDGGVTAIARNGGLLLVNEVNFLPDRIATVLFGFLDDRREITLLDHEGETIRAHRPGCWCSLPADECRRKWVLIAADMNEGYEGTRPLNKAFRNRFAIQIRWDYDPLVEAQLVKSPELLKLATEVRVRAAAGEFDTPVSTNMLQEFEQLTSKLGLEFAISNFIMHFKTEERPSIEPVFKTKLQNLEREVPLMIGVSPIPDVEDEPAVGNPFDYVDWR